MAEATDPAVKRGRGRPRGSGVVDPAHILSKTLDAIAEGGYSGLSMRGVAREVGVSLATVQHHFGTKAELWQAAIDHYFAAIEERRGDIGDRSLADRIAGRLDISNERPGFLAAVVGDRAPGSEERLAYLADRFTATLAEPNKMMSDMQKAGRLRPIDQDALSLLLVLGLGAVAGAPDAVKVIYGIDLSRGSDRDHLAAALADIIGNGLYPRG